MPYQEAPDPPIDDLLRAECAARLHVLMPDGTTLAGDHAVLHIYEGLGYVRGTALLRLPPARWLTPAAYALVANHRTFFSTFTFRGS